MRVAQLESAVLAVAFTAATSMACKNATEAPAAPAATETPAMQSVAPAGAEEPVLPTTGETFVVIVGGGTTPAEASAAMAAFSADPALFVVPAEGYPKTARSQDIPGLKPGFEIVVLGYCADQAQSELIGDVASLAAAGTYVRKVTGPLGGACPTIRQEGQGGRSDSAWRHAPLRRGNKSVEWELTRSGNGVELAVVAKGQVLARFEYQCRVADFCAKIDVAPFRKVGNRTLVELYTVFSEDSQLGPDAEADNTSVMGFECGKIKYLGSSDFFEGATAEKGEQGWKHLTWSGVNGGAGTTAVWNDEKCEYETVEEAAPDAGG